MWVQELEKRRAEIQTVGSFDGPLGPTDEPKDGERVIVEGPLPDELKAIYILAGEAQREDEEFHRKAGEQYGGNPDAVSDDKALALIREHGLLTVKDEFVVKWFWTEVHKAFPECVEVDSLAIRKGWKVVACLRRRISGLVIGIPIGAAFGLGGPGSGEFGLGPDDLSRTPQA